LKRLLVVTNAAAGTADEENIAAAVAVLHAGADVRLEACSDPADLAALVEARDGRQLVLAGGDGSVHLLVTTLHGRSELAPDDPIGLLPLGTGNDLARTLGIPLDAEAAATALLAGRPRALDLIVDEAGGVVVNVVHLGVGAQAAEQASALKDTIGKAAYAVGSAIAGVRERGWALRVEVDGAVVHDGEPVLMVGVCNGRTIGGGAEIAPDAEPDDGLLDVVVATSTGPLARLGFGVAMRSGEHVERDDVATFSGRRVTVVGEAFPANADGELHDPVERRTWTVSPNAWALVVPAS
jgi:YegS/Rv2252/BmrU family lipid kinase